MIIASLEISPNIYYTPDEVATMLRISRRSVTTMLETGYAQGIKVGRTWRVLGNELLRLGNPDSPTEAELTQSLMVLSAPVFAQVWGNDEDSVYDNL